MEDKPCYETARLKAEELLDLYDIDQPVVPVIELANRLGLRVLQYEPQGKLENVSGFLDLETKVIYVNKKDPSYRKSFTIAHELGHFLFGHNPNRFGVLYRFSTPIDKDIVEQEANCFAANLLVPDKILKDSMKKYELKQSDVPLLARMFGVSEDVIKYRLRWSKI